MYSDRRRAQDNQEQSLNKRLRVHHNFIKKKKLIQCNKNVKLQSFLSEVTSICPVEFLWGISVQKFNENEISEVRAKLEKYKKLRAKSLQEAKKLQEKITREEDTREISKRSHLNPCAIGFHWRGRSFVFSSQPVRCLTWFGRNRMASFLN